MQKADRHPGAPEGANEFARDCLEYKDELYRAALRFTNDVGESEDLVAETMLKAIGARGRFESGTNLRAWLHRILRNSFINRYRKSKVFRNSSSLDDENGPDELGSADSVRLERDRQSDAPLEIVVTETRRRILEEGEFSAEAMDSLFQAILRRFYSEEILSVYTEISLELRVVLSLSDILDLAYAEIANVMGTPLGTVMSRLFRARRKFMGDSGIQRLSAEYAIG